MSGISFNERRLLNRVRKLENRIGILSELCELRAGQEAEKISERYQERERGVLRELAGAEYERMSQPELEHTLTQHRQQAEREKFQKLQADAAMAGIVISRERQEELHKSLQRKLDGIAEEVRRELAAAGAARAGGDLEELRTEAERRIKSIRAEAEAEAGETVVEAVRIPLWLLSAIRTAWTTCHTMNTPHGSTRAKLSLRRQRPEHGEPESVPDPRPTERPAERPGAVGLESKSGKRSFRTVRHQRGVIAFGK